MIIYYSMMLSVCFVWILRNRKTEIRLRQNQGLGNKVSIFAAVIIFAYIFFWICSHDQFSDTYLYTKIFMQFNTNVPIKTHISNDDSSPLYTIIEYLFKKYISTNPQYWIAFLGFVPGVIILKQFVSYSENFYTSTLLFLLTGTFTWAMNGMRQFVAVAILFLAQKYIVEKRFFTFAIFIIAAFFIHKTSIIMLPLFFISTGRPWSFKIIVSILATSIAFFFVSDFTNILSDSLVGTSYEGATKQFSSDDGSSIFRVLISIVPPFLAWIYRNKIQTMHNDTVNMWINMSTASVGIYAISTVTSGILIGRLPIYLTIYNLLLFPYIFENIIDKKLKVPIKVACYAFYGLYFYLTSKGYYYSSSFTGVLY